MRASAQAPWAGGPQVQLLGRVFNEQFDVVAGTAAPQPKEKEPVVGGSEARPEAVAQAREAVGELGPAEGPSARSEAEAGPGAGGARPAEFSPEALRGAVAIQPKGKGQLRSDRVQNPHDPEATYAVKGQGQQKQEPVGYKIQVGETVNETPLAPGEPTPNFLTGIGTHPAHASDEVGDAKMDQEQRAMGMEKPAAFR